MKQYLGVKVVEAEPMTANEFAAKFPLKGKVDPNEDADGYMVKYDNGHISWSPKEVFEKSYKLYGLSVIDSVGNTLLMFNNISKTFYFLYDMFGVGVRMNGNELHSVSLTANGGKCVILEENRLEVEQKSSPLYSGELDHPDMQPIETVAHLVDEQIEAEAKFFNETVEKNSVFVGVDKGSLEGDKKTTSVFCKNECIFVYCPHPDVCEAKGCQNKK